jgi:hypothetical protein
MTDDHRCPPQAQSGASHGGRFTERWSRLEPNEQRLVTMAVEAMSAGAFNPAHSWERFADAAVELLPPLEDDTLTAEELHQLALEASWIDGPEPGTGASAPIS